MQGNLHHQSTTDQATWINGEMCSAPKKHPVDQNNLLEFSIMVWTDENLPRTTVAQNCKLQHIDLHKLLTGGTDSSPGNNVHAF